MCFAKVWLKLLYTILEWIQLLYFEKYSVYKKNAHVLLLSLDLCFLGFAVSYKITFKLSMLS